MLIVHVTSTDPAGSAFNFVRALNQYTPHRARLITTHKIEQYDYPGDLDIITDFGEEIEALLLKADVIHLHKVDESFQVRLQGPQSGKRKMYLIEDFLMIPNLKKKVVYHVHGHPTERDKPKEVGENYGKRGHPVLCSTPDLEEMFKPHCDARYFPNLVPILHPNYLPRETDALTEGRDGCKKLCVMQTPTDTVLKNTAMFKMAVEEAAKTEQVYFYEVYGSPLRLSLAFKRICHILCDHLQGYYGLCSLEGFSMGKPVIAGLSEYTIGAICNFFNVPRGTLPWINVYGQQELNDTLLKYVKSAELRAEAGRKGREFMETVWSDKNVADRLASFYQSL